MRRSLRLRDGRRVEVRPLRAEDAPLLDDAWRRLSPRSRRRRFLGAAEALTPKALRYLTAVDQRDHLAIAALDQGALVGVARCIREREAPSTAEMAITVVDSHQGLGLGTLLLGELAAWIRDQAAGIDTFRAWVDGGNAPMIELLEELGAVVVEEEEGTLCFDVPVPDDAERLPDTPAGRALRAAAREELAPRPIEG